MDDILRRARDAHRARFPEHKITVFANFIECETCGKHGHVTCGVFVRHDRETVYIHEKPEDF